MKLKVKISRVLLIAMIFTTILQSSYQLSFALGELPGARSEFVFGDLFLGGNYIEIGLADKGWFGTSSSAPSSFHPSKPSKLGMIIDLDGFDVGNAPITGDFFLPGAPVEGYGIGYKTVSGGAAIVRRNTNPTLQFDQNMSLVNLSSGDTLSAIHTVDDRRIKLEQTITLGKDDKFFKIDVKMTNITSNTLYDVRYFRKIDADQDFDLNNTYNTKNKVVENPTKDEKAMVYSKGPVTDTPFFYVSFDPESRASVGSNNDPYRLAMYDVDGEALINPERTEDVHIAITFAKGDIEPGKSVTMTLYQSLDSDINKSLSAIKKSAESNELKSISISLGSLLPAFDSSITDYSVTYPSGTSSVDVSAVNLVSGSAITINGFKVDSGVNKKIELSGGSNQIKIVLTSKTHEVKTYTINATVMESNELKSISLSLGSLLPAFDSAITDYSVIYPVGTSSVDVSAVNLVSGSAITINAFKVGNGVNKKIELSGGSNQIKIVLTSKTHEVKTYTINATVRESNELKSISLSLGSLLPAFDSSITDYSVIYPVGTSSVDVSAVNLVSGSAITINGFNVDSGVNKKIELSGGSNQIKIVLTSKTHEVKTYTINATVDVANRSKKKSKSNNTTPDATSTKTQGSSVLINGVKSSAGTEKIKVVGSKKVSVFTMKSYVINRMINEVLANSKPNIKSENTIKINAYSKSSDKIIAKLTGDIVQKLDDNNFNIIIETEKAIYKLPAKEIEVSKIAKLFKLSGNLGKIVIEIEINEVDQNGVENINKMIHQNGVSKIISKPLEFRIFAISTETNERVEIKKFKSYVEREIPVGDDELITTGILITDEGIFHVPTNVKRINGKNIVKIKSLTNSVYSVVYNPITVKAVENHWAKDKVNNMASRMILRDYKDFNPEKEITRAEFALYLTRSLGIYDVGENATNFRDVSKVNPNYKAILVAKDYDLFIGDENENFNPYSLITREESIIVIGKAMKLAGIVDVSSNSKLRFDDASDVSNWAIDMVRFLQDTNVIIGSGNNKLMPKSNLTHAEALTTINNMMVESNLSDK